MKKTLGRPRTSEEKRVTFTCMVKPSTRAAIDSMKGSRGVNIDKMLQLFIDKQDYNSRG